MTIPWACRNEKPPWLRYIACGSSFNRLPLLPSGPDGVGRRAIAQNLPSTPRGNKRRERDSNPRSPVRAHTPSKGAPSTTRTSLQVHMTETKKKSGERGIRTLGTVKRYNGFRVRLLRPLGHLSRRASPYVAKRIRTSDLQIRNLMLYPAELWLQKSCKKISDVKNQKSKKTERGGFEPPVPFPVQLLSREPDSAALAPLQGTTDR